MVYDNSLSARDEADEIANNVDPDEVAHNEPPHLDLHCLPFALLPVYCFNKM